MRSIAFLLPVLALSSLSSSTARAQVAVAVTIPDSNPTLRDVAAGVIDVVDDEWLMLQPQLDPVDVAVCKADATCLQQAAAARQASHLLVVGVAGLGTRDYVVSLQLYDASGKKLVDENTVETATAAPQNDGRALAAKLLQVPGMARQAPTTAAPTPAVGTAPSTLALAGVGLIGAGVVVVVGTAIASLGAAVDPASAPDRAGISTAAVIATGAAIGLAVAGATCVVVDNL